MSRSLGHTLRSASRVSVGVAARSGGLSAVVKAIALCIATTNQLSCSTALCRYLDGELVLGIPGASLQERTGALIPVEPMYLILNTAISHRWGMPEPCPKDQCAACWVCYDCTNPGECASCLSLTCTVGDRTFVPTRRVPVRAAGRHEGLQEPARRDEDRLHPRLPGEIYSLTSLCEILICY